MKKALKIFAVVLTLAMAMCIGVFAAACSEKEATEFTVTVLYPDGTPVDGTKDGNGDYAGNTVRIQFCDADNETTCWGKLPTLGADGTLVQSISEIKAGDGLADINNFSVHVLGIDESKYSYDQNIVLNSKNATVTIKLQAK